MSWDSLNGAAGLDSELQDALMFIDEVVSTCMSSSPFPLCTYHDSNVNLTLGDVDVSDNYFSVSSSNRHGQDDPMSDGTQLATADDEDMDQIPPEGTPITLLRTDMANLSLDEPLLDYDDLKVRPVPSDCMSSPISFVGRLVSKFTRNRH